MEITHPEGPLCQSCGIPMMKPELFGSEADGGKSEEYCKFCFQNGKFTEPYITMDQMIRNVSGSLVEKMGMQKDQAEGPARMFIPRLKRWRR